MNGRDSTWTPVHHPDLALTTLWNSWSVIHTIDMIQYILHEISLLGLKGKILWSSVYTWPPIGASVLVLQYANLELQPRSINQHCPKLQDLRPFHFIFSFPSEKQNFVSLFYVFCIYLSLFYLQGVHFFPKEG